MIAMEVIAILLSHRLLAIGVSLKGSRKVENRYASIFLNYTPLDSNGELGAPVNYFNWVAILI